jgi:hypothetical protein
MSQTVLTVYLIPVISQKYCLMVISYHYKKGNKRVPNNYRSITLISNFGKLFTKVLAKRDENWTRDNNIQTDTQVGFRSGLSTVDAIFVLHSLVERLLSQNSRLYYCL